MKYDGDGKIQVKVNLESGSNTGTYDDNGYIRVKLNFS